MDAMPHASAADVRGHDLPRGHLVPEELPGKAYTALYGSTTGYDRCAAPTDTPPDWCLVLPQAARLGYLFHMMVYREPAGMVSQPA